MNLHIFGGHLKDKKGFTFIELIVVISILAILSAVALPRYLSLKQDANTAIVENIAASFRYIVDNVRVNAILQGLDTQRDVAVSVEGVPINTYFGVPQEIWDERLGELFVAGITHVGNGYRDFGSSGVLGYKCTDPLCVIDQTPGSWISNDISGWGMFLFPESYTLTDKCYAYYAFEVVGSEVVSLETQSVITGC